MKQIFRKYGIILILSLTALLSSGLNAQHLPVVGQPEIRAKIGAFLDSLYAGQPLQYEVEWISDTPVWKIGQAFDAISIKYGRPELPRGQTVLRVEALANGRVIRRLSYSLRVRVFADVFIAEQNISANQPADARHFSVSRQEITRISGDPVLSEKDLNGQQTRRNIRSGAVLTRQMLEAIPLVERGDLLTLSYEKGSIHIRLQARALQDGGEGEEIWCMGMDSRQRYRAQIETESLAKLIP